jgi:hypothetical protein
LVVRRHEPTIGQFLGMVFAVAIVAAAFSNTLRPVDQIRDIAIFVGTYLCSIATSIFYYRLISTSHPLHSIPGPLIAKLTQFWLFKVVLK